MARGVDLSSVTSKVNFRPHKQTRASDRLIYLDH